MEEHRFHVDPDMLRTPERVAEVRASRIVALCLEGMTAGSVLDVGTGTGLFAELFVDRGLEVAGVDLDAANLDRARVLVPAAHFALAPAEDLPFDDRSFDLVFFGLVLHETGDARRALSEAARVSRTRVAVLEWPYEDTEGGPPLADRLAPDRVRDLATASGLEMAKELQVAGLVLYLFTVPSQ